MPVAAIVGDEKEGAVHVGKPFGMGRLCGGVDGP